METVENGEWVCECLLTTKGKKKASTRSLWPHILSLLPHLAGHPHPHQTLTRVCRTGGYVLHAHKATADHFLTTNLFVSTSAILSKRRVCIEFSTLDEDDGDDGEDGWLMVMKVMVMVKMVDWFREWCSSRQRTWGVVPAAGSQCWSWSWPGEEPSRTPPASAGRAAGAELAAAELAGAELAALAAGLAVVSSPPGVRLRPARLARLCGRRLTFLPCR